MFIGDAVPGEEIAASNIFKQTLFWAIHAMGLLAFWSGVSPVAIGMCFFLYFIRMFAITGAFHRYFSHRTYRTGRVVQFLLGVLGTAAAQKGPIWWASHHRHHHRHSDTAEDIHSPIVSGIYYAHVGWVLSSQFVEARYELVKDLLKFPELRLLDKLYYLPPIFLAVAMYFLGDFLGAAWGTSGLQMLTWGFFISTILLYHGTFCVNSAAHLHGTRRFKTSDHSRNSLVIALITLGEGWHNNHHRYPGSERQGMYWWEIDISHYVLVVMSWFGLVWDLRSYPERMYEEAKAGIAS